MAKFAVIGSNSFSGASFVKTLLQSGFEVVGFSRSDEPVSAMLPYKWVNTGQFEFFKMDLNLNCEEIAQIIKSRKIEYVVNFAAQSMVAESWDNPTHWFSTNVVSTVRLHDILRRHKQLVKYVHITTPEVYGSCDGFVDETYPFNPSTPYAVSRAAADMSLATFARAYDFPYVSTRAANVYGPGQQLYRIIPRTIMCIKKGEKLSLHGGGVSQRSFIHIDDVSRATLDLALSDVVAETYHISTNETQSIKNLVELICSKMNVEFDDFVEISEERLGKDASYQLNSDKLRSKLNWKETISLEQGISGCIQWVADNFEELKLAPQQYEHKV